jgi:hypothetical protein
MHPHRKSAAVVAPEEEEELTIDVVLQDSLLSGKYRKHLKKKKSNSQQTEAIGQQKLRELTTDEEELLSRSDAEWFKLIWVNTPKYRLDKQRQALVEQLTDFNLQYDTIYNVMKEDKEIVDELNKKFKKARAALKLKIDESPQGERMEPSTITSLHKLKFLLDHITSVNENISFFEMIMMDILKEEMKINQALAILKTTGIMNMVNYEMKYARGLDLSFSTQMIKREFKIYIKQLRERQPLDELLSTHAAGKAIVDDQKQNRQISTSTLLEMLKDSPPAPLQLTEQHQPAPLSVFEPRN